MTSQLHFATWNVELLNSNISRLLGKSTCSKLCLKSLKNAWPSSWSCRGVVILAKCWQRYSTPVNDLAELRDTIQNHVEKNWYWNRLDVPCLYFEDGQIMPRVCSQDQCFKAGRKPAVLWFRSRWTQPAGRRHLVTSIDCCPCQKMKQTSDWPWNPHKICVHLCTLIYRYI